MRWEVKIQPFREKSEASNFILECQSYWSGPNIQTQSILLSSQIYGNLGNSNSLVPAYNGSLLKNFLFKKISQMSPYYELTSLLNSLYIFNS